VLAADELSIHDAEDACRALRPRGSRESLRQNPAEAARALVKETAPRPLLKADLATRFSTKGRRWLARPKNGGSRRSRSNER